MQVYSGKVGTSLSEQSGLWRTLRRLSAAAVVQSQLRTRSLNDPISTSIQNILALGRLHRKQLKFVLMATADISDDRTRLRITTRVAMLVVAVQVVVDSVVLTDVTCALMSLMEDGTMPVAARLHDCILLPLAGEGLIGCARTASGVRMG